MSEVRRWCLGVSDIVVRLQSPASEEENGVQHRLEWHRPIVDVTLDDQDEAMREVALPPR